jgi:hypothetical protein
VAPPLHCEVLVHIPPNTAPQRALTHWPDWQCAGNAQRAPTVPSPSSAQTDGCTAASHRVACPEAARAHPVSIVQTEPRKLRQSWVSAEHSPLLQA